MAWIGLLVSVRENGGEPLSAPFRIAAIRRALGILGALAGKERGRSPEGGPAGL